MKKFKDKLKNFFKNRKLVFYAMKKSPFFYGILCIQSILIILKLVENEVSWGVTLIPFILLFLANFFIEVLTVLFFKDE